MYALTQEQYGMDERKSKPLGGTMGPIRTDNTTSNASGVISRDGHHNACIGSHYDGT